MTYKRLFLSILCFSLLSNGFTVSAMETDQYNLPTKPLADISTEVNAYTVEAIQKAIDKLNSKIAAYEDCLVVESQRKDCKSRRKIKAELTKLRSEDAVAKAVYKRLGAGMIPFTKVSLWLDWHEFEAQPARYKTSFGDSIHVTAPFNYLTISPTIRMYGEEFGTDKIAHIFQQGYDYYKKYMRARARGATEKTATRKAVKWGQMTEKTYFGKWVSAIYSNADLAANYAGLRFYQGLTNDVMVGDQLSPAMLRLEEGRWVMNKHARDLLRPYISRHLNEAYNPNKIFNIAGYRDVIRKKVKKRACKQWLERDASLTQASLENTTKALENWHGEDYGFSRSENFVTIANTCF